MDAKTYKLVGDRANRRRGVREAVAAGGEGGDDECRGAEKGFRQRSGGNCGSRAGGRGGADGMGNAEGNVQAEGNAARADAAGGNEGPRGLCTGWQASA